MDGGILRELCEQKEIGLLEGHAISDHVHLCLSFPPEFAAVRGVNATPVSAYSSGSRFNDAHCTRHHSRLARHCWQESGGRRLVLHIGEDQGSGVKLAYRANRR